MKQKFSSTHIITILLLVVFGSVGIFLAVKKASDNSVTSPDPYAWMTKAEISLHTEEQSLLQAKMDNYTAYNNAVNSLDPSACEKIVDNNTLKAECNDNIFASKASKDKDKTQCENINSPSRKAHCLNAFVYDVVVASGKQTDCANISGDDSLKAACIRNVVFAKIEQPTFEGEVSICDSLSSDDKKFCVERIKKDSDVDLLSQGVNDKSTTTCQKIQDQNIRNSCFDTVYITLAIEQKNAKLCAKIVNDDRKSACIARLSQISDVAILQSATEDNDLAKCSSIVNAEYKQKCSDVIILRQTIAAKSMTWCSKIQNLSIRKQCEDSIATITSQNK